MDQEHQKILSKYLPEFTGRVNPQQMLIFLPCLSVYSKEEIETAQNSKSRMYAAYTLYTHIIRRPEGFHQLVEALRHPAVNCTDLADLLNPNPGDYSTVDRNGGRQEYLYRRQSNPGHGHFEHNNVPEPVRTGWQSPVSPGATGRQAQVYPGTASRQAPVSPGTAGRQADRAMPKCDLNTPWRLLPGGVQTVVKKFDMPTALKKVEDLADLMDFNIEEIGEIKCRVPPEESLTLAFIECWMQKRTREATLWDIMKLFSDLERVDILQELERKTGVEFERPEEVDSPPAVIMARQMEGASAQVRNVAHDNPNINSPSAKNHGSDKMENISNKHSSNKECQYSQNIESAQDLRQTLPELDSRNYRHLSQNGSEIIQIAGDYSVENNEKDGKDIEKFAGYKEREILGCYRNAVYNHTDELEQNERERESFKKMRENVSRELSRELPPEKVNDGSEGFQVYQSSQNDNELIQADKNNLDRTVSSCSSNTENSTYDSITDANYINSLDSGDEKMSAKLERSKISNIVDESENEENGESSKGTAETKEKEGMPREDRFFENSMVVKEQSETLTETEAVTDDSKCLTQKFHGLQSGESPVSVSEEDRLKVDLSRMQFEEKLLEAGTNFSSIISQSDQPESREPSKRLDTSVPSTNTDYRFIKPKSKNVHHSIGQYENYSLEDEKWAEPDHTSYTKELNSIEKKAMKKLPRLDVSVKSEDVEVSNICDDNPTGSFQIDWDLEGADATDGDESEQTSPPNQPSGPQLDQSSNVLVNQSHQNADIRVVNEADMEMDFTRRGPELQKYKTNPSIASEEHLFGNTAEGVTGMTSAPLNMTRDENIMNMDSLRSKASEADISVPDTVRRNTVHTKLNENKKKFNLKDSCKTMCRFMQVVYDSSL